MSDETPRERTVDRRTLIVGGASAVAAGVLAPAVAAHDAGSAGVESALVPAKVTDHLSARSIEAAPIATGNRVRVDLAPGGRVGRGRDLDAELGDFDVGDTVAILLPPGGGAVDADEVGTDGALQAPGVVRLVWGKASDPRR
jgi:hypothetical protein